MDRQCLQNNSFSKDGSFHEDRCTEDDSMVKVVMHIYIYIYNMYTANNHNLFHILQHDPSMVELVSGYGAYCTKDSEMKPCPQADL